LNTLRYNLRSIQILEFIIIILCTININSVFGQTEDQTANVNEKSDSLKFWSAFIPPITAAGIAVIGTAIVGPRISKKWKDHEKQVELDLKEREFKNTFAADINNSIMKIIVIIMRIEEYLNQPNEQNNNNNNLNQLEKERDEEYGLYLIESHKIQSRIQTYFSNQIAEYKSLLCQWNKLMDFVKIIVELSRKHTCNDRKNYIDNPQPISPDTIAELLNISHEKMKEENKKAPATISGFEKMLFEKDIQAWYAVKHAIVDRKQEVIRLIIETEIPFFHPDKVIVGQRHMYGPFRKIFLMIYYLPRSETK
jgi:hypothetical protein